VRSFALLLLVLLVSMASCHKKPSSVTDTTVDGKAASPDAGDAAKKAPVEAAAPVTDDSLPPFASEDLTTRAKHLLEAIQKDNGELAGDIVFPRDAYLQVKDVPDPGKQWDAKVLAAFRKDVHTLHHHTKGIERAVFTSFELGQPATEAMPKKHDLKRMLWRAKRSRLGFTIDGKPSHFDVVEMTGWRGAWYVTKLR
jgi:hypothetical protein